MWRHLRKFLISNVFSELWMFFEESSCWFQRKISVKVDFGSPVCETSRSFYRQVSTRKGEKIFWVKKKTIEFQGKWEDPRAIEAHREVDQVHTIAIVIVVAMNHIHVDRANIHAVTKNDREVRARQLAIHARVSMAHVKIPTSRESSASLDWVSRAMRPNWWTFSHHSALSSIFRSSMMQKQATRAASVSSILQRSMRLRTPAKRWMAQPSMADEFVLTFPSHDEHTRQHQVRDESVHEKSFFDT